MASTKIMMQREEILPEPIELFDPSKAKRVKKVIKKKVVDNIQVQSDAAAAAIQVAESASEVPFTTQSQLPTRTESEVTAQYIFLHDRLKKMLQLEHPEMIGAPRKKELRIPNLDTSQSTRSKAFWSNFQDVCSDVNRAHESVQEFFEYELKKPCLLTKQGNKINLIIGTKLNEKQLRSIFKLYLEKCVRCQQCHSYKTEIVRGGQQRIRQLHCLGCEATSTINYNSKN